MNLKLPMYVVWFLLLAFNYSLAHDQDHDGGRRDRDDDHRYRNQQIFRDHYEAKLTGRTDTDKFKVRNAPANGAEAILIVRVGDGRDLIPQNCSALSGIKYFKCQWDNLSMEPELKFHRPGEFKVTLNNAVIVDSKNLIKEKGYYTFPVKVLASNTISSFVKGWWGSDLDVRLVFNSPYNKFPLADFSYNPQNVIVPATITFDAGLSKDLDGQIVQYFWEIMPGKVFIGKTLNYQFTVAGDYIIKLIVTDDKGAMAYVTKLIKISADNIPPQLTLTNPQNNFATYNLSLNISGSSNEPLSSVTAQLAAEGIKNLTLSSDKKSFTGTISTSTYGTKTLTIIGKDLAGNATTKTVTVQFLQKLPPVAAIKVLSSQSGTVPFQVLVSAEGTLDPQGQALTYSWTFGDSGTAATPNQATHIYQTAGDFTIALKVTNQFNLSDTKTITVRALPLILPPAPETLAPPVPDQAIPLSYSSLNQFIYQGTNPIQKNVGALAIDPQRVSVIKGRIIGADNNPIPGVKVTVKEHSEYGYTLTREDGQFDLAVNGGGILFLEFNKTGFLPVQRTIESDSLDFANLKDIVMINADVKATVVTNNATQAQVVEATAVTDIDGTRKATLLIPSSSTAQVELPNGGTLSLPSLTLRATEYTVGNSGPQKMPGTLPTETGYTYAFDLTADEALALGAKHINFSKPVAFYVDNFLNMPVGTIVPVGTYDYEKAAWVGGSDGQVIQVQSIVNNKAVLNVSGNGVATAAELTALGIDDEELTKLASLYNTGKTIWRMETSRFSPADMNFFSAGNGRPPQFPRMSVAKSPDKSCIKCGSIIEVNSQTLKEQIQIIGTNQSLNYSSARVPNEGKNNTVNIKLSNGDLDAGVKKIYLDIDVAGQKIHKEFAALQNLSELFTWNGLDAYGRNVDGMVSASIKITYLYEENYFSPLVRGVNFGTIGTKLKNTLVKARDLGQTETKYKVLLGSNKEVVKQFNGWTLTHHHNFDLPNKTLYLGNGKDISANYNDERSDRIVTDFAGTGTAGFNGDGLQALASQLNRPNYVYVMSDGSIIFSDSDNARIRKIKTDGTIETIAGTGVIGYSGDGGPAIQAQIGNRGGSMAFTEGASGEIYFTTRILTSPFNSNIRKIDKNGIISTVAGTTSGFSGDGGPAIQAQFRDPQTMAYSNGALYFPDSTNHRIRQITPDGIIRTIAGNGVIGLSADGTLALDAQVNFPSGIAVSKNGEIYFSDRDNNIIQKINTLGQIETVAGDGVAGFSGDGGPANQAKVSGPTALRLLEDNTLYFNDNGNLRIRMITPDGMINTFSGSGVRGATVNGTLALEAKFTPSFGFDIAPNGDFYLANETAHKIYKIASPYSKQPSSTGEIKIASDDGSEIYSFNSLGLHLYTQNAVTGAIKYSFTYDSKNYLISITDGDNNQTQIVRDSNELPTQIISPFGQITQVIAGTNDIESIITPIGTSYQMLYNNKGFLTRFTKPNSSSSLMSYGAYGELLKDENSIGGFTSLVKSEFTENNLTEVLATTAMNRQTFTSMKSIYGSQYVSTTESTGYQENSKTSRIKERVETNSDYLSTKEMIWISHEKRLQA